jgi:hypothetical protein
MPSLKNEGSCTLAESRRGKNKTGSKESKQPLKFFVAIMVKYFE